MGQSFSLQAAATTLVSMVGYRDTNQRSGEGETDRENRCKDKRGKKLRSPDPSPLRQAAAVFTRHDGGGGGDNRDKFGRKPQIKAALKKAAGFCRGSAKTLHESDE